MDAELSVLQSFRYSFKEWRATKWAFMALFLLAFFIVSNHYDSQPFPEGICQWFECVGVLKWPMSILYYGAVVLAAVMYLLERHMLLSTAVLTVGSILCFSIERSNGIYHREELFSLVLFMQTASYARYAMASHDFRKRTQPWNLAMFGSVAIISAAYVMAGVSKLMTSGLYWVIDSPKVVLKVMDSFEHKYIDNGWEPMLAHGQRMADLIQWSPLAVQIAFAFALIVELSAFLAVRSRKTAVKLGLLILLLHLGMFLLLHVKLVVFIYCVAVFLVGIPARLAGRGD